MKLRLNPEKIKGQIFQSIRSYVFVAWFPDLSVAIRICILACLYNWKANRNQFSKYFEVYMILKDDCTERPLHAIEVRSAEVETCNMRLCIPLLGYQFFMGHVTSYDQGFSSTRWKILGSRLCVLMMYKEVQSKQLNFCSKMGLNIEPQHLPVCRSWVHI
jgi:hypothetical protein